MKVGDRVILPNIGREGDRVYPYQGTIFACAGRISRVYIGSYSGRKMAQVEWDNGRMVEIYTLRLGYESNELNKTNPNHTFLLEKRRRK